ncbi:hypothetical protein [Arcanobacterium bovis]|nr:hypothetical protein [Arcanobacterium bovis]
MFNFFLGKPAFPCDSGDERTVAETAETAETSNNKIRTRSQAQTTKR